MQSWLRPWERPAPPDFSISWFNPPPSRSRTRRSDPLLRSALLILTDLVELREERGEPALLRIEEAPLVLHWRGALFVFRRRGVLVLHRRGTLLSLSLSRALPARVSRRRAVRFPGRGG